MKSIVVALTLLSQMAFAAVIKSGSYNEATQAIELEVSYGGGCEEHTFTLDIGSCLESYPVQCREVKLVEDTHGDACEAIIHRKVVLPLKDVGLSDSYYNGASLTIHGDAGSKVNVRLPFVQ